MTFVEKIQKILEWGDIQLAEEYLHAARMKLDGWRNFVANHKKFPPHIRDDLLTKAIVKEFNELVKLTKELEELLECY